MGAEGQRIEDTKPRAMRGMTVESRDSVELSRENYLLRQLVRA